MRCRSCNVLNMHALGKRVTQISMNVRAVAGVNEVNCLGMLGCGMWGQLLIGEYVYWSAHVHVWICICIPWRGQTLHITAYDTMSRSVRPFPSNSIVQPPSLAYIDACMK